VISLFRERYDLVAARVHAPRHLDPRGGGGAHDHLGADLQLGERLDQATKGDLLAYAHPMHKDTRARPTSPGHVHPAAPLTQRREGLAKGKSSPERVGNHPEAQN